MDPKHKHWSGPWRKAWGNGTTAAGSQIITNAEQILGYGKVGDAILKLVMLEDLSKGIHQRPHVVPVCKLVNTAWSAYQDGYHIGDRAYSD